MVGELRKESSPGNRGTFTRGRSGNPGQTAQATGTEAPALRTGLGISYQSAYYFPSLLSTPDSSIFFPRQADLRVRIPRAVKNCSSKGGSYEMYQPGQSEAAG
jgi:hypothetical protein